MLLLSFRSEKTNYRCIIYPRNKAVRPTNTYLSQYVGVENTRSAVSCVYHLQLERISLFLSFLFLVCIMQACRCNLRCGNIDRYTIFVTILTSTSFRREWVTYLFRCQVCTVSKNKRMSWNLWSGLSYVVGASEPVRCFSSWKTGVVLSVPSPV